jgi:hypothetical protein
MRWLALAAGLALGHLFGTAVAVAGDPDVPVALRTAVKTLAAEQRGITAFHRHVLSDQRAPGHNERIEVESARLRQDGHVVAVRLYHRTVNGVATTTDELAKKQAAIDKDIPGDDYRLPVTEDSFAEYRFGASTHCGGCDDGVLAIPFTSVKRDDNHCDGTIYVDERNRRILRLESKPSVLPKQADSGEITVTFGRATSDLWDVVSVKQKYSGHLLFIHGTFETTATQSAFRRFDSLDQARSALASGT